ncbi:hypothetical protein HDU93_001211 [Gonapodya sp. JEL0774]|nr:hypothetical protein HDU93_001211 [Gonapodya sp. JEL0774]
MSAINLLEYIDPALFSVESCVVGGVALVLPVVIALASRTISAYEQGPGRNIFLAKKSAPSPTSSPTSSVTLVEDLLVADILEKEMLGLPPLPTQTVGKVNAKLSDERESLAPARESAAGKEEQEDGDDEAASPVKIDPDIIDEGIFEQLLEMDEDEDREFSRELVVNYFEQARTTFEQMERDLSKEDLEAVGKLGHFLKGSSGALGLIKVRASCEEIQHMGKLRHGGKCVPRDEALRIVGETVERVKSEFEEARRELAKFYDIE